MARSNLSEKPSRPEPADYVRFPLSGAWLMANGFRVLEKRQTFMYAFDIKATDQVLHTLYLTEQRERFGQYPRFRYTVLRIVSERNQPTRVYWDNEIIRTVRDVRFIISRFKGQ